MTWRYHPESSMPYPEIVEPDAHTEPYEVFDTATGTPLPSNGMTDKVNRHIHVPLRPDGRPVSRHELAHVRWSPLRLPNVKYDARVLMAVEDARINCGLARLRLGVDLRTGERATVSSLAAKDLEQGQPAVFVMRAIASIGTNAEAAALAPGADASAEIACIATQLVEFVREELEDDRERTGEVVARFGAAKRIAREVARRLEALGLLEPGSAQQPPPGVVCCPWSGHGDPDGERLGVRLARRGHSGVRPGRMTVRTARLSRPAPRARGRGRKWRPGMEGSVVRWPYRWTIDGAIFRRPVRRAGGTVLVDTSGSMSLDQDAVDHILSEAPWATLVAIYSGDGDEGELRIVARAGRRAEAESLHPFGTGNIVDLPALQWLARQPAPRIWISDGGVTGVGDRSSPKIKSACTDICRRAGIHRAGGVEKAAAHLAKWRVS